MSGYAFILTRGKAVPAIDKERLLAHVKVVTQVFDTDQGIARAREAAKDFDFPPEVFTRDASSGDGRDRVVVGSKRGCTEPRLGRTVQRPSWRRNEGWGKCKMTRSK